MFNKEDSIIRVKCLPNKNKSAPQYVLKKMKEHLQDNIFGKEDSEWEAWLVVDKDAWQEEQINELFKWTENDEKYNLAVSNPNFEFWLLLHFEDAKKCDTTTVCKEHLKRYLLDYSKNIDKNKFIPENIIEAIKRAKEKDTPPCPDWPRQPGKTTVYRLVEKLL